MPRLIGYVFGYASLADPDDHLVEVLPTPEPAVPGAVEGWVRRWNAAIENTDPRCDHKHCRDADGRRFQGAVVSLNLVREDGRPACNGLAVPVDGERLELLDQRETLMHRVDVGACWAGPDLGGRPLWAYVAEGSAVEAYREAKARGTAVVRRAYTERVAAVFAAQGEAALRRYLRSTDPPDVPVVELDLVRAPGRRGVQPLPRLRRGAAGGAAASTR